MQILVLADVHANLAALEAVLTAAPPVDAVWNLGDSIGYGPWPSETMARLTSLQPTVWLAGNHDLAAIGSLGLDDFNQLARAAAEWTGSRLSDEDRRFLAGLTSLVIAERVTLAHGSPREPVWEYVSSQAIAAAMFGYFETAGCLVGHTHVPLAVVQRAGGALSERRSFRDCELLDLADAKWLINPGSVGQPRDGDPRASFAVFDLERQTMTNYRVAYDVARTQRAMAAAGLPQLLIERLRLGR